MKDSNRTMGEIRRRFGAEEVERALLWIGLTGEGTEQVLSSPAYETLMRVFLIRNEISHLDGKGLVSACKRLLIDSPPSPALVSALVGELYQDAKVTGFDRGCETSNYEHILGQPVTNPGVIDRSVRAENRFSPIAVRSFQTRSAQWWQ